MTRKLSVKKSLVIITLFTFAALLTSSFVYAKKSDQQEVRVLKISFFTPITHFLFKEKVGPISVFVDRVEKGTNGRIKFKIYPSQQLGKTKDQFDIARNGIADMSGIVQSYTPGYFPLTTIIQLPFAAPGMSASVLGKAAWEMNKRGLLDEKYKDVKVILLDPTEMNQFFLKKKINSMDDFKGMKIGCSGGAWMKMISLLGATPVPLGITDEVMAMRRGMVDGFVHNWAAAPAYKTYEVTKYVLEVNLPPSALGLIMNLDTWNSLPPDIQKVIDDVCEDLVGKLVGGSEEDNILGYETVGQAHSKPLYIQKGVEAYTLPPAEMAKMHEALMPVWDEWVQEMEAKGLHGKKVMEAYLSILKELGAKPVYKPTWK
jgi:TRAP-type C4-dicarboxylate transport system substrate-binding protein